jgi:hypothetical protein
LSSQIKRNHLEHLNSLFKNLRDRLSSPLIFSFILAWLIINWKITIGLVIYKMPELKADGYHSYMDMVNHNINTLNVIFLPLLIALAYVFIYPPVRNAVTAFQTWTTSWGPNWELKVSGASHIPIEKYIELKKHTDGQIEILANIIKQQNGALTENDRQKNEIEKLIEERNEVRKDLDTWKSVTDPTVLHGDWEQSFSPGSDQKAVVNRVTFSTNTLEIHGSREIKWSILNFYNSPDARQLTFVTERTKDQVHQIQVYTLEKLDNMRTLRGTIKENSHYYDVFLIRS